MATDNLEKLRKLAEIVNEGAPSKAEIMRLIQALAEVVKKVKADLERTGSENTASLNTQHGQFVKRFEAATSALRDEVRSDSRTTMRYIDQKLDELVALIPQLPDFEGMIAEVRAEIPEDKSEEYDAHFEDIDEDLIRLEKLIEEIKARPQTGGGVTNARIAQAFKYILKTEEPVGDIDGVNATYRVSQPIFSIIGIVINGETIAQIPNYTINGREFTFSTALPAAYSGKDFEVKYI